MSKRIEFHESDTIGKLLIRRVSTSATHPFIGHIKNDTIVQMNYQEYFAQIENMFWGTKALGPQKGDRLAIMGNTCKEWHLFDMTSMCSNMVTVPIYHTYTPNDILYIIKHAECNYIAVEDEDQLKKLSGIIKELPQLKIIFTFKKIAFRYRRTIPDHIKIFSLQELIAAGEGQARGTHEQFIEEIENQDPSSIASIIYTSGTTGEPKGAVITHKAICHMLKNVDTTIKDVLNNEDRILTWLPLSHVYGRADSLMFIPFGWEMIFAESLEKLSLNLQLVKPTILLAVPRIFEKIHAKIIEKMDKGLLPKKAIFEWAQRISTSYHDQLSEGINPSNKDKLQHQMAKKAVWEKIYKGLGGRIRFVISGGAPLNPTLMKFLRNAGLNIAEGYGLTETIAPCTLNPLHAPEPGSVGMPLGDVQIKFDEDGEILIKSEALFCGYHKREEDTREAFTEDGFFKSGDIGEFNEAGYLKITDRKKDIIITAAGKNVAPQKIENMLKLQKHISQAAVVGDKRKYLVCLIGIEKEDLKDKLGQLGLAKTCSYEEMAENQKLRSLIWRDIERVNGELARFETIKKFIIIPEPVTVETGLLTPSLKIKKKVLIERYAEKIEDLYPKEESLFS